MVAGAICAQDGEFRLVGFIARVSGCWPRMDSKAQSQLAGEGYLRGNRFCQRAAHYLGAINALHPFCEGNGRAQLEFIRELAVEAGSESFATILNKIIRPAR